MSSIDELLQQPIDNNAFANNTNLPSDTTDAFMVTQKSVQPIEESIEKIPAENALAATVEEENDNNLGAFIEQNSGVQDELAAKMKEIKDKDRERELRDQAQTMRMGYVNLKGVPIPVDALENIPLQKSLNFKAICFYYAPHKVARVAVSEENIADLKRTQDEIGKIITKVPLEWFLTSQESFATAEKQYQAVPKIIEQARGVEVTEKDLDAFSVAINSLQDVAAKIKDVSLTELVTLIIAAGIKIKASDIHIETEVDGVKLRYRIDGVLHTAAVLARESWQQLIARLKLLAELKLNIVDRPQDGRFSIFTKAEKIDVRVSTLPTAYGESVVMRLLMSKSISLKFDDLGLRASLLKLLREEMSRPNGMLIATGPTGSGKTTLLYSILKELNTSETKIITIEDPIEYELAGINQSQVDEKRGYTFAKGLRSIVRQDPDIVMVGEMRDLDTVDIGLNAALTGHLVLSTLHTNDAAGAIPRFLAMGAKPYLLAPALNLVIAQRLVRRLCPVCKQEFTLEPVLEEKVRKILEEAPAGERGELDINNLFFFKAVGCTECNQIGYLGRVGIFEMLLMNKDIEKVILSEEISEYKIRDIGKQNGMTSMVYDGLLKAAQGVTSVDEVFRVAE